MNALNVIVAILLCISAVAGLIRSVKLVRDAPDTADGVALLVLTLIFIAAQIYAAWRIVQ